MDRFRAEELFRMAYHHQILGDLELAIDLYKRSIEICPTAEAYTFLGWSFSFLERYDEAIDACKQAIALDPEFGIPYNDIGSYLIVQEKFDEAIPYLEKATKAKRYEDYHYPHCSLGRIYLAKGMLKKAREEMKKSLEICPDYLVATELLNRIDMILN